MKFEQVFKLKIKIFLLISSKELGENKKMTAKENAINNTHKEEAAKDNAHPRLSIKCISRRRRRRR